jgi:hypothetical protein
MSEREIGSIPQLAQKLVHRLPKETNDKLKKLIRRAEGGEDTSTEIIDLLSDHDVIVPWMLEQIDLQSGQKGTLRGYGRLAGAHGPVPASKKWACSKSRCTESLPVIQEGEDAPTCSVHGLVMIRSKKEG